MFCPFMSSEERKTSCSSSCALRTTSGCAIVVNAQLLELFKKSMDTKLNTANTRLNFLVNKD